MRTYVCLPGAWMGAWSWQFVIERLRAAGHEARALPFPGVGERAAELSPALDNDVFLADTLAVLEKEDLRDIVLVGHSFGSLIAGLVTDRMPERIAHLVIVDGGIPQDGQSIFGRIPPEIVAKRKKLVKVVNGTEVLPFAPVGSLIIDDPELATWTHRQLTPHPLACYTKPIRLYNPPGNGRPMTYIACTKPRYPVSVGNHEKAEAMPGLRFRPIEAGHNCIISAPDLVAAELLAIP
ncbi:Pimeloyl-ACP methyl ester carboxylesterase [Enhydrobacter aerosaccus]|uniref:Pimeloyl-ACP methyl ester carboxylesterase n=1 Tax=Enhydrobacter aerosaccus TaxID=225324 RepID=A0A1T4JQ69_9HYPH|nr:alpha/beta hydrolase [Enhydrobacter aerosaccus]SJZ32304.1 Pimeloyl-ACP methyl ester carboxylesterase [Enhydrobacter aerosaccus]